MNAPNVSNISNDTNEMSNNLINSIKEVAKSLEMIILDRKINSNFQVKNPWFDTECYESKISLKKTLKLQKKTNILEIRLKTIIWREVLIFNY